MVRRARADALPGHDPDFDIALATEKLFGYAVAASNHKAETSLRTFVAEAVPSRRGR